MGAGAAGAALAAAALAAGGAAGLAALGFRRRGAVDAFLVGTVLYAIVTALLLCPPLWLFGARATLVGLAAVEGAFFLARRAERRRAPASPPPSEPVPEAVLHHLLDL